MGISGFTVARNVVRLGYPATQSIESFRPICDELILSYDPWSDDGTEEWARKIAQDLDLRLFESKWEVMESGQMWYDKERDINEIARQTAKAAAECNHEWNLYVQLDEAFHEDDHETIRDLATGSPPNVTGIDFLRVCFFRDLHTIRADWSVPCTRMVRKGTHDYLVPGGGMSSAPTSGIHAPSGVWMFHYVRIGDPQAIARRVRNLDTFYHDPKTLLPEEELSPYDFKTRKHDNYAIDPADRHEEIEGEFRVYKGHHPAPFAELYKGD